MAEDTPFLRLYSSPARGHRASGRLSNNGVSDLYEVKVILGLSNLDRMIEYCTPLHDLIDDVPRKPTLGLDLEVD